MVRNQLQPLVCDPHTLSNVEGLQFVHLAYHPVDAVVTDVAGAEGEGPELVQALGDVSQALVADLVAEGHIKPGQPQGAHGQMHYPRVTDVVA